MFKVSTEDFEELVHQAVDSLPKVHRDKIQNVAFFVRDLPSPEQRIKGKLRPDQTLLGLYEGVALPRRNGTLKLTPDIITIFQIPMEYHANSLEELKTQIKHTVWHEVAHYFGLDHKMIYEIEDNFKK